ncbi:MAG: prolyl oligopeptidase family serine peptidase [Gammaproteobacteria bacterium]|nr:prolyl oligopeptidase family serine peptidase [Gammaproteobacteria bacterium]
MKQVIEYGHWPSSLTAATLFAGAETISSVRLCREGLFFLLSMPEEGNALALMHLSPHGQSTRVSPPDFNVRSAVHEYGGMPYTFSDDSVFFCNFSDQRLYQRVFDQHSQQAGALHAMTPDAGSKALRYADMIVDEIRQRLICVREDHRDGAAEPRNTLISIALAAPHDLEVLFEDSDFVATPSLSPDGTRLAFQTWSHPNMPWDDTQIHIAELSSNGHLATQRQICPKRPGSLLQPMFSPTGDLTFIADWSDWWNLYRISAASLQAQEPLETAERLLEAEAEVCGPQWQSGQHSYDYVDADTVLLGLNKDCAWSLALLDLRGKKTTILHSGFGQLDNLCCQDGRAVFLATTATASTAIYSLDLRQPDSTPETVLHGRSTVALTQDNISKAQHFSYSTTNEAASKKAASNGNKAYGLFYAPQNSDYEAPTGTLPPLLVSIHGGPTGSAKSAFNPGIQFWTSRGFAWLDVNHRGSAGYGRRFRRNLYSGWGVVDVQDIISAVRHLIDTGKVAADRIAIRGGSAGGYAVLAALVQSDLFRAGTSYYGISDLELLARDTHKFESRYLDQLIGPYPEAVDTYRERSPLYSITRINAPVLLLQGRLDKVVPPNQADAIFTQLQRQNPLSRCVYFDDEGHGFRKPHNQMAALEAEFAFYEEALFNLPPTDHNLMN